MASLKLFVFGPPRLEADEQPVELNLRKALALLVYLAVSGQPQSRDALATLLWPDGDQSEGRARLRRTLHRLNQTLGDGVLDVGPDAIRLHPAVELWIDSAAFRAHVAAGLPSAPVAVLAPERIAQLNDAVALYSDDFLAGFTLPDSPAFDEWQFFTRESLRQLYGQVLEQLVGAYRSQNAWEEAIPYARRWVALDTLHEPAHRALMRLYAQAGQQGAALRQYQECVRILEAELGAEPEAETTALYDAIRTRQIVPEAAAESAPAEAPTAEQRYVADALLAIGGQAEVYRGRDTTSGHAVAIKRLSHELIARHPHALVRFVREGELLRQLQHPNIVSILDTYQHNGHYAIVMEYIPGGSLRNLLEREPQLPVERVLHIGLELADALSRAHHLGIVHRDLKPENVLLAADGTPRLTDFGLARLPHEDMGLTQTGMLVGSPAYMSPEAVRGADLDGRHDVWALGVVLFELLTRERPFTGAHITSMITSILELPAPDVEQSRPDVPPSLNALLRSMLAKDRSERVATMRQVAAELEAIRLELTTGNVSRTPSISGTSRYESETVTAVPTPPLVLERDVSPGQNPASFTRFGDLLRFLRLRARLTQREFSIAVGYNFAHVSRLEQGARLPDPVVVAAVFVPALDLEAQPAWAARLVDLAEAARAPTRAPDEVGAGASAPPTAAPQQAASETPPQAAPLLVTKLYLPRPRPDRVARPRLLARLNAALRSPLTVVSAPAGFGKTTLIADWLASLETGGWKLGAGIQASARTSHQPLASNLQVAWLALDGGDNDPITFLRYLIAAFQTIVPTTGSAPLAMAQSSQPPALETLFRLLLNDLATLPHDIVVVLDDYHLITTPAIHTALALLLDHLPPTIHFVLATRADPPLPLARLRARGVLVELRAADLRFQPEEATTFLTDVMGVPLSADDIAALDTRTEGWIAGLQLAALAMRDRRDLHEFIRAFTGSNRFVVDYLAAEVFERQPSHLQTFLLQTAILNRLCGPLCDAVMGLEAGDERLAQEQPASRLPPPASQSFSQLVLDQLEQANLFLVPLDDHRRWYRYHHLFGEVLRQRLMSGATAGDVATLHRRASAWFERYDSIEEAIHHALAAGDDVRAATLVEERVEAMFKRDDFVTLRAWLDALPEPLVLTRPWLCLAHARLAVLAHDLDAGERWIERAEHIDALGKQRDMRADILAIRMYLDLSRGELPHVFELGRQALALTPPDNLQLRADILQRVGVAHLWSGQLSESLPLFAQARQLSEAAGNTHIAVIAATNYGATLVIRAQLRAAERYLRQALEQFGQHAEQIPIAAFLYIEQANLLFEWNQLDQAARHADAAILRSEGAHLPRILHTSYLIKSYIVYAKGDIDGAQDYIDRAVRLARHHDLPERYVGQANAAQLDLWARTGNVQAAQQWVETTNFSPSDASQFLQTYELLAFARLSIAHGATEQAHTLLNQLYERIATTEQRSFVISTLVLQAVASSLMQPTGDQALATLKQALALAEPEGYVRTFVDEGAPIAALLAQVAVRRTQGDPIGAYAERLLLAFPRAQIQRHGEAPGLR